MSTRKKARQSAATRPESKRRPRVKQRAGGNRPSERPREIAVFDPDAVESVLDVLPDDEQLMLAADRLSGMGHPSRLRALIALSVAELCVGDIAAIVGLSLSATSTMLKQLRSLGFLATRSAGKQTYYRLASVIPGALMEAAFTEETFGEED